MSGIEQASMGDTALAEGRDGPKGRVDGMVWVPGGRFTMGSNHHYPEEKPERQVEVDGFYMDRTMVTNREFARFVAETGFVTLAEVAPKAEDYPGALPELLKPASLVFTPTTGPVPLDNHYNWWAWTFGADWRHPTGPDSSIEGMDDHPVVHIAYADAEAYATWAGKQLATEAEWEFAARGGLEGKEFAWGDELVPPEGFQANTWQGAFPHGNSAEDGYERTSPVGAFPPNGYGLLDMIGNAWEWTEDWYGVADAKEGRKACCVPKNPRGAKRSESFDPATPEIRIPQKVLKGGSHLCTPLYCRRYRPAARHAQPTDSATSHIGFRCIVRVG